MPRPAQSEEEREETRIRIVQAARTLFDQSGFEAVSMRAIGQRVGLTASALYAYFPAKSDILRAVWSEALAALTQRFQVISESTPHPLTALQALGRTYAEFGFQDPVRFRVLFMTTHESLRGDLKQPDDQVAYFLFLDRVRQAVDQGLIPPNLDPDLVAQTCWAGIHGVVALHITCTDFTFCPPTMLVDAMLNTLILGLTGGRL